jgi:adenylate kinase
LRRRKPGPALVFGHLLPSVLPRVEVARVAVLRCEPMELRRRLRSRGYDGAKIAANIEAELIGLIAAESLEAFGSRKVVELDTTGKRPEASARSVAKALRHGRIPRNPIDWLASYASAEKLTSLLSVDMTESART